jgi:uncharacterized integral membrane protein
VTWSSWVKWKEYAARRRVNSCNVKKRNKMYDLVSDENFALLGYYSACIGNFLRDPWRRHDSVETCRSVVIYKLIVIGLSLVILQNNKKMRVTCMKIIEAQQAKICNNYKIRARWRWHDTVETCRSVVIYKLIVTGLLLVILQNNKKMRVTCMKIIEALRAKICNNYKIRAPWRWHDSVETCRSVVIYKLIVTVLLLVILQNNTKMHGTRIKPHVFLFSAQLLRSTIFCVRYTHRLGAQQGV